MINQEVAKYEREVEDYSDGYDISSSREPVGKDVEKVNQVVSSLETRTLAFLITEQRTEHTAFGTEGRIYQRIATISRNNAITDLRELGMIEGILVSLGYHKANN